MSESLSDVYEQHLGGFKSLAHLYAGSGLFIAGILCVVTGILFATTDLIGTYGYTVTQQWGLAGIIAGLGIPATFLGVFTVMPQSSDRMKIIATVGAAICLSGVLFFNYAFPTQWHGDPTDLTFYVVGLYSIGIVTTFWSMFTAVINFKTRNNPGGTVSLEITQQGETKYVEVDKSDLRRNGIGGLGLIGETPDGNVQTQTARDSPPKNTDSANVKQSD